MDTAERYVTDLQGVRYTLGRRLGQGGQGAVFEVEGGKLAVKLLFDASPERRERLQNQLAFVKRLPLHDVDIARPLAVLRAPHLGYVMELLTGMKPLESLASPPRGAGSVAGWYLEGGGLRRRLRLLARVAGALAQLHGKGLVYGDLSPQNVFVSESTSDSEVRLIDADNLRHHASPGAQGIYTPGYGAPELVLGRSGANSLTDAHAFAVAAFRVLTLAHPLLGNGVLNGEPEAEAEALAGKLPFIDHPDDASNGSTYGLPRALVLSPKLAEIVQRAFVQGLLDATKRPGVAEWAERLETAADLTIRCPTCGGTYYHNVQACPLCEEPRPPFVAAIIHLWDPSIHEREPIVARPNGKSVIVAVATLTAHDPLIITERLGRGIDGRPSRTPRVEVQLRGRRVVARSLDEMTYQLTEAGQHAAGEVSGRTLEIELDRRPPLCLHLGSLDKLHRVVRFEFRPGGRS